MVLEDRVEAAVIVGSVVMPSHCEGSVSCTGSRGWHLPAVSPAWVVVSGQEVFLIRPAGSAPARASLPPDVFSTRGERSVGRCQHGRAKRKERLPLAALAGASPSTRGQKTEPPLCGRGREEREIFKTRDGCLRGTGPAGGGCSAAGDGSHQPASRCRQAPPPPRPAPPSRVAPCLGKSRTGWTI